MEDFAWDRTAVLWGAKHYTRPSQRATHTRLDSFVLRRLLNMVTTDNDQTDQNPGLPFEKRGSSPMIFIILVPGAR